MNNYSLNQVAAWFDRSVSTFKAESPEEQRNYDLKTDHACRVRAIMERLAASLSLLPDERTLASTIAI